MRNGLDPLYRLLHNVKAADITLNDFRALRNVREVFPFFGCEIVYDAHAISALQ